MAEEVRLVFLGGLGEIGRNCAAIEHDGRIIVVDCGIMFPDQEMPGVDLVLPDFSYLKENAGRIEGIVLTHGHEDHVGGLGFLLRDIETKVFGSALSLGLAQSRLEDSGSKGRSELITVADGERRKIGPFDVEFIPVTHSVPQGFAVAFHTPQGVVLHSGDFKLDLTPVDGRRTDLARIGSIADTVGIRLLLSDSTNAEEPGFTRSERSVGETLRQIFVEHPEHRVLVACFASHIHRIQQLSDAAIANGRKIALLGRSMLRNVALARELGLLSIPPASLIDVDKVDELSPGEVCVISTGSQGEPMSALSLLAAGESRRLTVTDGDIVVLSSHAIPGNEWAVAKVIDGLARRGANIIHSGIAHVHESGHGKQGELATLHQRRPSAVLHPGARGVPAPVAARPPGDRDGGRRAQRAPVRGRRRRAAHRRADRLRRRGGGRATSSSTGWSATSAWGCCATGGYWPRRASSSSCSPSTPAPGRSSPGRRSSRGAGCTPPRPRNCSTTPAPPS